MKIILDTNVWRRIHTDYSDLNQTLTNKNVDVFLSETVFTLEAVRKETRNGDIGRLVFFQNISSNDFNLNQYLEDALNSTRHLGIKILKVPRIGMPFNVDLPCDIFFEDEDVQGRMEKIGNISRAFQNAGYEYFKNYINDFNLPEPWQIHFEKIPLTEEANFAKAIAEWADGDTVSACYGYNIDYLCTADNASSAGSDSIFSTSNKTLLSDNYGLKIVSPSELEDILRAVQ